MFSLRSLDEGFILSLLSFKIMKLFADATAPLTCLQLIALIMVMHCLSFPAFPAVAAEWLLTSQDNRICSFHHIVAAVLDVGI